MRSEERSGIILAIMLLLWGTLVTEPLRIFTDYSVHLINKILVLMNIGTDTIISSLIIVVAFTVLAVLLLLLSSTGVVRYIPITISGLCIVAFLRECLKSGEVNVRKAVALLVICGIIGIIHLLKLDSAILWVTDFYIAALPVYLLVSLVLLPLALTNKIVRIILYITRYAEANLALPFAGFLTLPGIVWGLFLFVMSFIFILYFSFARKEG